MSHRQGGEGGPGPGRGATAARLTSPAGKQAVRQADAMLQFVVRFREAVAAPPFRGGAEQSGARGRRGEGCAAGRAATATGAAPDGPHVGKARGWAVPPPLLLL